MKAKLVCLIIIVCFLGLSIAKTDEEGECSKQKSCSACTPYSNCGWCSPTQTCMNGTKSGPTDAFCIGSNWEFTQCTPCNRYLDCRSCNVRDADCFWCSTSNSGMGQCQTIGQFFGCNYTRHCPCGIYGSCTECANDAGCQWCQGDGICVLSNTTCKNGPAFNYTMSCPCAGNSDCPNCQSTDGCDWCNNGLCSNQGSCTGPPVLSCMGFCNNVSQTCDGCVNSKGCAWCALTKQCVDSTTSTCPYSYQCATCNAASYCDICQNITDCEWCDDTKSCQPVGYPCFAAHTCSNYCNTYTNCQACSVSRGCAWCDDTATCQDSNSATTCFLTHTCTITPPSPPPPQPKCGFNGGSLVGGMFLMIGLVVLCVGGYLFYRWRTGRKFDYNELK